MHSSLSLIVRGGDTFMARCLDDFGITPAEVIVLMYLYGHDKSRQEDIAAFYALDKGSVAKTLQKLEKKGLVERTVNEEDQREKVIRVTEKGFCVRGVCTDLVRDWHEAMFQGITKEESVAFERVLGKIANNVAKKLEWR